MRGLFIFSLLLLFLISDVNSVPIPGALTIMNSYDRQKKAVVHQDRGRVAVLRKANKEANSQYKHMERVMAHPTKPKNAAVISKSFGDKANLHAIGENVQRLKKKTLLVKTVNEPFNPKRPDQIAFTRARVDQKKHLHFADHFFNSLTPLGQAGNLVHEASHALLNTKDHFSKDEQGGKLHPVSQHEADWSVHPAWSGYLHSDFEGLRAHGSYIMHQNADSYRAFGHYAKYGVNAPMHHVKSVDG
jgi:hypothetical protein